MEFTPNERQQEWMAEIARTEGRISHRYVRQVNGNFEQATKETADCIGEYTTDDEGLPQHVRDIPLSDEAELRADGYLHEVE